MRRLLWRALRAFFFRIDAESAHHLVLSAIRLMGRAPFLLRWISGTRRTEGSAARVVAGLRFSSPVGLAAGFDKNGEILAQLPDLGFGFAEIGTVTPRAQPGNDRPRLFRKKADQALFNRMGFNNLGASVVAERLARARAQLPTDFKVGVNLGKNKDTPLDQAADDYSAAANAFRGLADYLVINVSSPNTAGLRSLQAVENVVPLLESVQKTASGWEKKVPIFLKLAPELDKAALAAIISASERCGVDGFILTNTLAGQWKDGLPGGWSGFPVAEASIRALKDARALTRLPIISVGGILDPESAQARIAAGAELVQIYTGWVYGGPDLPSRISQKLSKNS